MKIKEIEVSAFHEMTVNLGNYNSTKFGEHVSYKVELNEDENIEQVQKELNKKLFELVKANVAEQVVPALKESREKSR